MYYLLDERTRLAGCHMVREAVERVDPRGGDRPLQAVLARGDRGGPALVQVADPRDDRPRALPLARPFFDVTFADKQQLPARARRDFLMHAPFEVRIGGDGDYALDMDGASAWGWHSMNCTPSGMQGAIWVQFTQTLICNDKVNDGAYLAIETNFPEGTIANLGDAEGSTGIAWAFLQPAFTGFPRTLSRALQARGFIEEVIAPYSTSRQRDPGRRHRPVRQLLGDHELRDRGPGHGRQVRARRHRHLRGDVQPRGRRRGRRDVGADLPDDLPLAADQGEHGRRRPPPGRIELRVAAAWSTAPQFWELQNLGSTRILRLAGSSAAIPGSASYVHNIKRRRPDRAGAARRGVPARRRRASTTRR